MTIVDIEVQPGSRSGTALVPRDPNPQKATDYRSDQEVRWCPGCGDYSILAQMKKALANRK